MSQAAGRYAKSLLGIAQEQNALEQVHNDMQLFEKVCEDNREFVLLMRNPIINHDKKLNVLEGLFKGKVHDLTMAIFTLITRKNREGILYEISREFHNYYNLVNSIKKASVTSAVQLTDSQREGFKKIVEQATAHKVELKEVVDPELLGGFVLNVEDKQIDASVKSKLRQIEKSFSDETYISKI